MRSPGMFACCSLLVACSSGNGTDVTIVVTAPDGFDGDTVQLIVGKAVDVELAAIAPEGMTTRDGVPTVSVISTFSTAIAAGETVELSLDLGTLDGIDVVAAIAGPGVSANADGQSYVAAPTATAFRYRVGKLAGDDYTKWELVLAHAATATDASTAQNQVLLWGAPAQYPAEQRCLYLRDNADDFHPAQAAAVDANGDGTVDASDDDMLRGLFILASADDRDCDGLPNEDPLECSADVYLDDSGVPGLDKVSCVTSSGGSGCRLGGQGCIDGRGPDGSTCTETRYCAPGLVCSCQGKTGDAFLACLLDLQADQGGLDGIYVGCTVKVPYVTRSVANTVCAATVTKEFPAGRCASEIRGRTRETDTFSTALTWGGQRIDISTTVGSSSCSVTFAASGHIELATTVEPVHRGALLAADLTNGSGAAIPAMFTFQPEAYTGIDAEPCADATAIGIDCQVYGAGSDSGFDACIANQ